MAKKKKKKKLPKGYVEGALRTAAERARSPGGVAAAWRPGQYSHLFAGHVPPGMVRGLDGRLYPAPDPVAQSRALFTQVEARSKAILARLQARAAQAGNRLTPGDVRRAFRPAADHPYAPNYGITRESGLRYEEFENFLREQSRRIYEYTKAAKQYRRREKRNFELAGKAGKARDYINRVILDLEGGATAKYRRKGFSPPTPAPDLRPTPLNPNPAVRRLIRREKRAEKTKRRTEAVLGLTGADNRREAIRLLREIVEKGDNVSVVSAARGLRKAFRQAREADSGLAGFLSDVFNLPIFNLFQTPYYASQRSRLTGGDLGEQLLAFIGGFPGLGFVAGDGPARRAIEDVNTLEERELLRRRGQLASFGEFVTGSAADVLKGEARRRYLDETVFGFRSPFGIPGIGPRREMQRAPDIRVPILGNITSGSVDLAFQVFGDPTFIVGAGLRGLAKPIGEFARRAADDAAAAAAARGVTGEALRITRKRAYGRAAEWMLRETATGQGLWHSVVRAAQRPSNLAAAQNVMRTFRGMPDNVAHEVAEAAGRSTEEALRVVRRALVEGSWDPFIRPLRTQLRLAAGLGRGVGRSAVRVGDALSGLRSFANRVPGQTLAVTGTRSAERIGAQALRVALEVADRGVGSAGDFIADIAARRPTKPIEAIETTLAEVAQVDNVGLRAYAEQRLRPFLLDFRDEPVRVLMHNPAFQEAINEVDAVLAVARGEAGPRARAQILEEMTRGFKAQASKNIDLVRTARRNVGLAYEAGPNMSRDDLNFAVEFLPEEIQATLLRRIAKAKGKKGLARVAADIRDLVVYDDVLDETLRLARQEKQRLAEQVVEGLPRAGLGRPGIAGRAARAALAVIEPAPPSEIWLTKAATPELSMSERAEAVAALGSSLGLPDIALNQLKREAAEVTTERELFKFAQRPLEIWARQNNVNWSLVQKVLDEADAARRQMVQFADQETGRAVVGVMTPAQLVERAPVLNPEDLLRAVRAEIARSGTWSQRLAESLRVSLTKAGDLEWALGAKNPLTNKPITVRTTIKGGHRFWKFLIVTNAYMPIVGAVAGAAGFIEGGADAGAALGGVLAGGLAGGRYIARVVGIEERARYFIERGFHPPEWVPVVSRHYAEFGIPQPFRAADYDLVRPGGIVGPEWENRFIQNVDPVWDTIARGERRFLRAWHRIVRFQLNPEVYEVDRLLLMERAGHVERADVDKALAAYAKTDEGKKLLRRMKSGVKGPGDWKEFIARERLFIETYTTPIIAAARLRGIPDDDLRRLMANEMRYADEGIPKFVHGERSGPGPKVQKLYRAYNDLTGRAILSEPTTRMNRFPMYRWKFREEYFRRVRAGMDPEQASREASAIATRNVNETMLRIDGESRFARKADFLFPFQQPREEFFRVWTKLVYRHPGRTLRTLRLGALAFNNGEEKGLFSRDPYTGEWRMPIPGSATLNNLLFGHNEGFNFNLRDLLFIAQGTGFGIIPEDSKAGLPLQILSSSVPTLGGPYWLVFTRLMVNNFPEWFEERDGAKGTFINWLMPYGPGRDIFRPEARRLWMAITGSTPPWLFLDDTDAENELRRYLIEVARSLYAKNVANGAHPNRAWPTEQEVEEATRNFFQAWAFWGSVWPALPRPAFSGAEEFQRFRDTITLGGKLPLDRNTVLRVRPDLAPYLTSNSEWTGPEDFEHWAEPLDRAAEYSLRYRRVMTLDKFKKDFDRLRREFDAYRERQRIFDMPQTDPKRNQLLDEWEEKYPELAERTRNNYFRDKELLRILSSVPRRDQDEQINRWRLRYGVSYREYLRLRREVPKTFVLNPWREAREPEVVVRDVQRSIRNGLSEEAAVSRLPIAEQMHWWNHRIDELDTRWDLNDDPAETLQSYYDLQNKKRQLRHENPILNLSNDNAYERFIDRLRGEESQSLQAIYAEIDRIRAGLDLAYQRKAWSEYNELKAKRDALFDLAKIARDSLYQRIPDLSYAYDTLRELALANTAKDWKKVRRLNQRLQKELDSVQFLPTNQELAFRAMPESVQAAYINKLVRSLNMPSTKGATPELRTFLKTEGYSKLFWDWLTHFQQDLLERHLPPEQIELWKGESYAAGMRDASAHIRGVPADLAWVLEMLKHYDTRRGGKPPRSYAEYLDLPASPILRQEFLRNHPEVARWVGQNPLLAMPEPHRSIAVATLTKYGNFGYRKRGRGFRSYGYNDNPELAFAFYQLRFWNRRPDGASPPETYDLWLNMPSGPEKAEFLRQHPEIQEWLSLGPMANMPDEYKDVVRDIMLRYGKWTEREDPLSKTISAYYRTPVWARRQFLEEHPELLAYWTALRGPEEQRLSMLADQYFALQDANARRLFLAANPELQEYLIEQRTRRYERFLNRVAIYMGTHPELFEAYLENQEEVFRELLRRFAEPPLVREAVRAGSASVRADEAGRRRRPR